MYKQIQTERLIIRPINLSDSAFIIKLVNSEGWIRFIGDRNVKNKFDAEKYIQKILDNEGFFYNVFELKETNQAIGIVTFLNRENQSHPDIGFALLPKFEKRGYTFEACKRYLGEIISMNKYENVFGITKPDNNKSIRLLTKLGLHHQFDYNQKDEIISLYSLKKLNEIVRC
jgi:RimJ/RimL family protein N-acetyltransferase